MGRQYPRCKSSVASVIAGIVGLPLKALLIARVTLLIFISEHTIGRLARQIRPGLPAVFRRGGDWWRKTSARFLPCPITFLGCALWSNFTHHRLLRCRLRFCRLHRDVTRCI